MLGCLFVPDKFDRLVYYVSVRLGVLPLERGMRVPTVRLVSFGTLV